MGLLEFDQSSLTEFYSHLYLGPEKHDSPDASRLGLVRQIVAILEASTGRQKLLDIGAGRQALEKQLHTTYHDRPWFKDLSIVSVDIADILKSKLLALKTNISHSRTSALALPFTDNSFNQVVSNLAIDFLPPFGLAEAARVLAPDGVALFNFHHPSLYDTPATDPQVKIFWEYLRTNHILFESPAQIAAKLSQSGLCVGDVQLDSDGVDKWWVVSAQKKPANKSSV